MHKEISSALIGIAVTLYLAMLNPHSVGGGDTHITTTINVPVTVIQGH